MATKNNDVPVFFSEEKTKELDHSIEKEGSEENIFPEDLKDEPKKQKIERLMNGSVYMIKEV